HARLTIGDLIGLLQILANIVRVEERHAARFLKSLPAKRDNVSVSTDQDTEITEKGTHPSNRLAAVLKQLKLVVLLDDPWHGQILRQTSLDRHRTCARTTTAMRCREGLVKVHMKNVDAHVTGFRHTHQRVQVRPIQINQASLPMDNRSDSLDVPFE